MECAVCSQTIPCAGEIIESEGCCLRHACLFDIWICEYEGNKVYDFNPANADSERLRQWKRVQFQKWLDTLTLEEVNEMLEEDMKKGLSAK